MKAIQQQIDKLVKRYGYAVTYSGADVKPEMDNFRSELATLLLSVQDEQKSKSEAKAQELFAEQASVDGRAMTPSVVKHEMNRVDYAWEPTKEEV